MKTTPDILWDDVLSGTWAAPAISSTCSGFTIAHIVGIVGHARPHTPLQSRRPPMDLYIRKVIHPQSVDNYRALLKDEGLEIEIGSIEIRHGSGATEHWVWASIP
jgi:hypothetical protein